MSQSELLAKHIHEVYFGGNWTASNLQDQLKDVTWTEANTQIFELNSILKLVYHINYYAHGIISVLRGGPLDIKDKYSFDHPKIDSAAEWENFLQKIWQDGETVAKLIAEIPVEKLDQHFVDEEYGTYYRNFIGLIEHTHYHLGQIVVIKKILRQAK